MSTFWSRLTGSDPEGPRRDRRPKVGLRPEVASLEGRQLMAVTMGTTVGAGSALTPGGQSLAVVMGVPLAASKTPPGGTGPKANWVLPAVQVSPKFLFPSDGRYVPETVSGGLSSGYVMNFVGQYAIFPKPASTANILSQLPLPNPTSPTAPGMPTATDPTPTYKAFVPGSKVPLTVSYALDDYSPGVAVYTVKLPDYKYSMTITAVWQGSTVKNSKGTYDGFYQIEFRTLPISDFEASVITARFDHRQGPVDAVLNVTDQYRQDEPRATAPLTLLAAPITSLFGLPTFVKSTYNEKIFVPTGETILRQYGYSFSTHFQALKHPGTNGRQYIVNVSSEDADDGGSANTAAVVPNDAPTIRR